uniref:Uncharacterized protein n=1 Tax=Panagrolaimus davidi TaxID=227884 RepID=A0A914P7M6_9BILA
MEIINGIKTRLFCGEEFFVDVVCIDEGVVASITVRVLGGKVGIVEGIFVVVITVVEGNIVEVDMIVVVGIIVAGEMVVLELEFNDISHGALIFAVKGENGKVANEIVPIGVLQKFV